MCAQQAPGFMWMDNTSDPEVAHPKDMATDNEGNVYTVGYYNTSTLTFDNDHILQNESGWEKIFLVKHSSSGEVLWAKSFGGNYIDLGNSVTVDANNNVYITGKFRSTTVAFGDFTLTNSSVTGNASCFFAKLDSDGAVLWAHSAQQNDINGNANDITVDTDGNVYATGSFISNIIFDGVTYRSQSSGLKASYIVKYNSTGSIVWVKVTRGSCEGNALTTDADDNLYVTGNYSSPSSNPVTFGEIVLENSGVYLAKYDTLGDAVWVRTGNSAGINQNSYDIVCDEDDNVVITGFFSSATINFSSTTLYNTNPTIEVFVVKYNSNGDIEWAKSAGGTGSDKGCKLTCDSQSNIFLSGYFQESMQLEGITLTTVNNNNPVFVAKFQSEGELVSAFAFESSFSFNDPNSANINYSIATTANGNLFAAARNLSSTIIGNTTIELQGMWIGKLEEMILSTPKPLIKDFKLFPNPVTNVLNVESTGVIEQINIYNALGQKVLSSKVSLGTAASVNMAALPAGYYIAEMISNGTKTTKKVVKN